MSTWRTLLASIPPPQLSSPSDLHKDQQQQRSSQKVWIALIVPRDRQVLEQVRESAQAKVTDGIAHGVSSHNNLQPLLLSRPNLASLKMARVAHKCRQTQCIWRKRTFYRGPRNKVSPVDLLSLRRMSTRKYIRVNLLVQNFQCKVVIQKGRIILFKRPWQATPAISIFATFALLRTLSIVQSMQEISSST